MRPERPMPDWSPLTDNIRALGTRLDAVTSVHFLCQNRRKERRLLITHPILKTLNETGYSCNVFLNTCCSLFAFQM